MLPEAIRSVPGKSTRPEKIIVVDDGFTDETRQVVEKFGSEITCRYKEDGGNFSAINLGLKGLNSKYVRIFDDYDVALSNASSPRYV